MSNDINEATKALLYTQKIFFIEALSLKCTGIPLWK